MRWWTRRSARLRASGSRGASTNDGGSVPPSPAEERSNEAPEMPAGDFEFSEDIIVLSREEISAMRGELTGSFSARPITITADSEGSDMEKSAATQLDAIRNGSANMLLTIRHRLNEATKAMEDGEFIIAQGRLTEALQCIGPLAHAQSYLAIADSSRMIRAAELEAGMTMTGVGEITEVVNESCDHDDCPGHFLVTVTGFEQPVVLDGDHNVYVVVRNG